MALSLQEFADQLSRCAQSDDEALQFVEAFARVRLDGIIKALAAPLAPVIGADHDVDPDWSNEDLLTESGITLADVRSADAPQTRYLHIDVAVARKRAAIRAFLDMAGLSDKQKRDLFPALSASREVPRGALAREVQRLNSLLQWSRERGVEPAAFLAYHRHLAIHGASQNISGSVGAMGAAIAFTDALEEIHPGCIVDRVGAIVPVEVRSPEAVADYLATGSKRELSGKKVAALKLVSGRFIVFASDPDCSIFMPIVPDIVTAADALSLYNEVRKSTDRRRQALAEFAVGEVKTATDRSNLHERLALGGRETKVEVNADRFLMMALLTRDILEGGTGQKSARAPLQNRDTVRFSHVFNLHHAWGWDGGRERHPGHWNAFKGALKVWCNL